MKRRSFLKNSSFAAAVVGSPFLITGISVATDYGPYATTHNCQTGDTGTRQPDGGDEDGDGDTTEVLPCYQDSHYNWRCWMDCTGRQGGCLGTCSNANGDSLSYEV